MTQFCNFAIVLAIASFIFITGIPVSKIAGVYDVLPAKDSIGYSMDLTGGFYAFLEVGDADGEPSSDIMDEAMFTLHKRIESLGIKDFAIAKLDSFRVVVSIPNTGSFQQVMELLTIKAGLEVKNTAGEAFLSNTNVEKARRQSSVGKYSVLIELDSAGKDALALATGEEHFGENITIVLDGKVLRDILVETVNEEGIIQIDGIATDEEAVGLADLLNIGELTLNFAISEVESFEPVSREASIGKIHAAGLAGFLVVFVYLIIVYRGIGVAASLSLISFLVIYLNALAMFKVSLTVTGLLGIVASFGIVVGSHVALLARCKDEFANGKAPHVAISEASAATRMQIQDSNIAVIALGLAVSAIGIDASKSFAATLLIGTTANLMVSGFLAKWIFGTFLSAFELPGNMLFGSMKRGGV